MTGKSNILLICDDEQISEEVSSYLRLDNRNEVHLESGGQNGLDSFRQNNFDIVIAEFGTFDVTGVELIKGLKKIDPDCVIVTLLHNSNQEVLKDLYALGVYEVVYMPLNLDRLRFIVRKGTELHSLLAANHRLNQGLKEHNVALEKQNVFLAKRIEESTKNLTRLTYK